MPQSDWHIIIIIQGVPKSGTIGNYLLKYRYYNKCSDWQPWTLRDLCRHWSQESGTFPNVLELMLLHTELIFWFSAMPRHADFWDTLHVKVTVQNLRYEILLSSFLTSAICVHFFSLDLNSALSRNRCAKLCPVLRRQLIRTIIRHYYCNFSPQKHI